MKTCLSCDTLSADAAETTCRHCGHTLVDSARLFTPQRRGDRDGVHPIVGKLIGGKYRVTGLLGRGGSASVFRAVHEGSLVPVALKVLHPRFASRLGFRDWFLEEARKAGRIAHGNIARVLDVGTGGEGVAYLATELVEGQTLDEWLAAEPGAGVPVAAAVEVLLQVARALAAAHEAGVVHRDLTPRNVMIGVREAALQIKVLDFGIARASVDDSVALGEDGRAPEAEPGRFATPPYAAPETLSGAGDADARADLYSLGVLGFELLTGSDPVRATWSGGRPSDDAGGHANEIEAMVEATAAGRIATLRPRRGLPRPLVRLVNRLLARDPSARPASTAAVVRALERIAQPSYTMRRFVPLAILVVALLSTVVALRPASAAFLTSAPGSALRVHRDASAVPATPVAITSAVLLAAEFQGGGFEFDRFEIVARPVVEEPPPPQVAERRDGLVPMMRIEPVLVLELQRERARGDRVRMRAARGAEDFVTTLAERGAEGTAFDLEFRVRDRPPLAHARVLVDDVPPSTELGFDGGASSGGGPIARGDTEVSWRAADNDRIADASLLVFVAREDERTALRYRVDLMPRGGDDPSTLVGRALLADFSEEIAGVVGERDPVEFVLEVVDRSGNVGRSSAWRFDGGVDTAAPAVVDLEGVLSDGSPSGAGGAPIVPFGPGGASLRLEIDAVEQELTVRLTDPTGATSELRPRQAAERLDIVLPSSRAADGRIQEFPGGIWSFCVVDRAGNVGAEYRERLGFRSLDPRPVWSFPSDAAAGHGAVIGGRLLVTDGDPAAFEVRCSDLYRPIAARIVDADAGAPGVVRVAGAGPGRARVELSDLPAGVHRLSVALADAVGLRGGERVVLDLPPMTLVVRPDPVVVQLPGTAANARFLPELEEASVLRRVRPAGGIETAPVVTSGIGWVLDPDIPEILRLRAWIQRGREEVVALGSAGESRGLVPPFPLGRGLHVLYLEARDVLGRAADIRCGDAPAAITEIGGLVVAEICRFHYHDRPFQPLVAEIPVERSAPPRVVLGTPLPLRPSDEVSVVVGTTQVEPWKRSEEADVCVYTFLLPLDEVLRIPELVGVDDDAWGRGVTARLPVTVVTPATGPVPLELRLRTTRSTLASAKLGEIARGSLPLPDVLAELGLVPVPGLDALFRDPVPVGAVRRERFRPYPPTNVRGIEDFYLQAGEFRREQLEALLDVWRERRDAVPDDLEGRLVHALDPLGAARLEPANLRPRLDGDPVRGIDFFQAWTLVRILGVVVAGDPDLLRLPTGTELEYAAFGPASSSGRLHASGEDRVVTDHGEIVVGLDFGVREWVLDFASVGPGDAPSAGRVERLLEEWRGNHERLLEVSREFAAGAMSVLQENPRLADLGVLRGCTDAERAEGLSGAGGALPPSFPGVVRTLYVRRDGRGLLPGDVDPNLSTAGFRVAAGAEFVRRVRMR
jgi:serine/threonine protein kinase